MNKKKLIILCIMSLLLLSLVGCGEDTKLANNEKANTEYSTQQQTTTDIKITEEVVTTTEDVITTEAIDRLQTESMETPLQFGDVVTIHNQYYPNAMDQYDIEAEMSITAYENEFISCDVKLKNISSVNGSQDDQNIYFDCNFLCFTLYDENYVPIDYGYPINSSEGYTQGESNKLTLNQVHKGKVGPLKGSYNGAIPKYISFQYASEIIEPAYFTYNVYYEIPDGLFDPSYTYVDMSVLGADSAEQALELCKEAINNNDANIAKKISLMYYGYYEKTGRVLLEEWDCGDYLYYSNIENIVSSVNQEPDYVEEFPIHGLEYWQNYINDSGGNVFLQAGYQYRYYYLNTTRIGCHVYINLCMCDGRWFAFLDYSSND